MQLVREIRASGYGRHTTTASTLLDLPSGGCIIDTPGVRDLGVAEAVEAVDISFADLVELATSCRFHDCGHRTEPGCAIITAVALDELDYTRVESWRKLGREAQFEAARSDARVRRDRSAQSKKMCKQYRSYQKHNPKGRSLDLELDLHRLTESLDLHRLTESLDLELDLPSRVRGVVRRDDKERERAGARTALRCGLAPASEQRRSSSLRTTPRPSIAITNAYFRKPS